MDWKYNEWDEEHREVAKEALLSGPVIRLFDRYSDRLDRGFDRGHFLRRAMLQTRIAAEKGAVIIGESLMHEAMSLLKPLLFKRGILHGEETEIPDTLTLNEFDILGLDFAPKTLSAFSAIRQNAEVSEYAAEFRHVIDTSAREDLHARLQTAAEHALRNEKIARQAAAVFETASTTLGLVSMIPLVGVATGAAGLGADAAGRASRVAEHRSRWYLIGAKMHEVAIRSLIEQK
jgi:hypothetical protein